MSQLPRPTKIKRKYVCNTTGVVGVAGAKGIHSTRKLLVRYVASWRKRNGERNKATFSVGLYGENEAFRLAVASRRAGLRDLNAP